MKYYAILTLLWAAASAAWAQSVSKTYTTDINGNRVEEPSVIATDHQSTEVTRNLNGRRVPLEQIEEKVLRQEGNTKVTQKIVKKFDANGQAVSTERQIIEEQTRPGGSTTNVTTYRADVNGRENVAQRQTTETEVQGSVTKTESSVERANLNGSFETVEKRSGTTEKTANGTREDQTTYQRSGNGGYVVRARSVKETTRSGDQTTEKSAVYQPFGTDGQLRVTEQSVATTTKRPDGTELVRTDLYGSSWNGNVGSAGSALALREQDEIQRTPGPGGSVTESLVVRRPTQSNPNKLGPPEKVSETVCTGKCNNP